MMNKAVRQQSANEIIKQLPTGLLRWYPFREGKKIVYVGDKDSIFEMLSLKYGDNLKRISLSWIVNVSTEESADYIISIGYPEKLSDISSFLDAVFKYLKKDGRLILGMNNRFGIRYFCGDKDPHTGQVLDGIEDYSRAYNKAEDVFMGRAYDKASLRKVLINAGFIKTKFYSVLSGLENPSLVLAEGYTPNESLCNRIFPTYNDPRSLFLEEEKLYKPLLENDMFHSMANAFLIECTKGAPTSDALQITNSLDRGKENAVVTVIHDNDTVTKIPGYEEGQWKIQALLDNARKLKKHGIHMVAAQKKRGIYTMPYIKAPTGQIYLEELLRTDRDVFLTKMDEFRDLLYASSETYEGYYKEAPPMKETAKQRKSRIKREKREWGEHKVVLLKEGMIDMVPLNSLYVDGHFVFLDQEFCIPDLPVDVLVTRMIFTFFYSNPEMTKLMDPGVLYDRYGLPDPSKTEGGSKYLNIEFRFFDKIMNRERLYDHYKKVRRNSEIAFANRHRMNFSNDDYQRLFVNVFEYADSRKLILFGSGLFAKRFLALYGEDYKIYAVIDNNEKRWGEKLFPEGYDPKRNSDGHTDNKIYEGIDICSPDILCKLRHGEYKIIICIRNYLSVMNQLGAMGITEYSIFDPGKAYERKRHPICRESMEAYENSTVPEGGKKYHVGYIAGVFDLYHVGHLNMFRRAKEQCDYLIVGVVSDEGVRRFKQVNPFVPFDERIEMVRSCRYVDEAVEIPYMFGGTEDAWKMHHFDVQFSGSDYVNSPGFARFKDFLEKHGATLEFFPYTQSTSSTKLKALIEKKLI